METKLKGSNIKLVDISTQYSKFNTNQVLTETQMNTFLDYFDDQDRLTRTSLDGVGIVCGFAVNYNTSGGFIRISQGRGVTTDGDLIALLKPSEDKENTDTTIKSIDLDSKIYKYVKQFSDNKAEYKRFLDADGKQIKLWELQQVKSDSNEELSKFTGDLKKMVVLLYLESYSKEGDLCSQLTCDNQGIEQVARLRALLVSDTDARYIASTDTIYNQHNWYETYTSLPEISAVRVVLNTKNTKTFQQLKNLYFNAVRNNNVLTKLGEGLNTILKKLGKPEIKRDDVERIFGFTPRTIPIDFQYRYDALKDLIDTYNEIKELLLDLNVRCSPKVQDFPKHLMLGRLHETQPYPTLRHAFYKSPAAASFQNQNFEKLLSLLAKVQELLDNYNTGNKETKIKITPSLALNKLSNKAVPYYYNVISSLLSKWNFKLNKQLKSKFNLSYHKQNLANVPYVQRPLRHNLDHFDFYRIEGHQGRVYREALEEINKIKEQRGLSFDVKTLSVDTDIRNIDLKNYKCQFEDLKILLDAWRAEQDCVLAEVSRFLSSFSTANAGKNLVSEREGYNKLVEKRKEALEKQKEKAEKEKLEKEKAEKESAEKEKAKKEELERVEERIKEYEAEMKVKRKERLLPEEKDRLAKYEMRIKELEATEKKEEVEKVKKEMTAFLKKADEAKMSDEELQKKKEYELAVKTMDELKREIKEIPTHLSIKDSTAYPMAYSSAYMESAENPSMMHSIYSDKSAPSKEGVLQKRRQDAMWERIGLAKADGGSSFDKDRYKHEGIWGEVGAGNLKVASDRAKRKEKNIVKEVLAKDDNTVGKTFNKVLEENPKASKNEIMAIFRNKMAEAAKREEWQGKENMKKFILEDTADVLVKAYVLDNEIPKEIEDINEEGLSKYKVTIEELCQRVKKLQSGYDSLELDQGTKQIMGLLINQLSTVCCSGKKLEILYEEIQKRKDDIIIQTKLSEFVKNHPGLEHKAGVKPGGTFVMVYLKEAEEGQAVYENVYQEIKFTQQPEVREGGQGGERGYLQLWSEKYQISFTFVSRETEIVEDVFAYDAVPIGETLEETVGNFSEYLNQMFKRLGITGQIESKSEGNILYIRIVDQVIRENSVFMKFQNPATVDNKEVIFFEPNKVEKSTITEKNTVIADFSLPYLCCSDCNPVNYVVPKEPVELSLPEKHICLKEGETVEPMAFKVSPANGKIAPMVPDGIESGLTFDNYGRAFFDGNLTDPSLHGKPIGFTVNHELTECTVTVYADVPLSVTTNVVHRDLNTRATVIYKLSNVYRNLIHKFDDGNGNEGEAPPSNDGVYKVTYDLPVNNTNTIHPKLSVTNGVCEKDVPIEPITFEDPVEVTLKIIDSYCLDRSSDEKEKIPFTEKDPADQPIGIVGGSVEGLEIVEDQLIITPKKFKKFDEKIAFTLGGLPTNAAIVIGTALEFEVISDPSSYFWEGNTLKQRYTFVVAGPTGQALEGIDAIWKIDGNEVGQGQSIEHDFAVNRDGSSYQLEVQVKSNNGCSSTKKKMINVAYPDFVMKMPNDQLEYCLNDEKTYSVLVDPFIKGTPFTGLGTSIGSRGELLFSPIATGLSTPAEVDLRINNESLLKIQMSDKAKAGFTWEVKDGKLVVTNTSEKANNYLFKVGEFDFERKTKKQIIVDVGEFGNSVIDISLTTVSPCGNDTHIERRIKVREESDPNTGCVEDSIKRIKTDRQRLPDASNVDIDPVNRKRIIDGTISLYDTTLAGPPEVLSMGNVSEFVGLTSMFEGTVELLTEFPPTSFESEILSQYYIAQNKLFFNLIHCQPHEALERDKDSMMEVFSVLTNHYKQLRERDIKFDSRDDLKRFYKTYAGDPQVIKYIKDSINRLARFIL